MGSSWLLLPGRVVVFIGHCVPSSAGDICIRENEYR